MVKHIGEGLWILKLGILGQKSWLGAGDVISNL